MTTIVNAIPEYLITVTVSVAFFVALKLLQNFIHTKVIHAKTETSRTAWSYAAQLADTAVASLVGKDMAGHEKFVRATQIVQSALEQQGIKNVDLNAIEAMVQAAYEKSPLTPTTNPEEKTDKSEQKETVLVPDGKAKAIDPKEVA